VSDERVRRGLDFGGAHLEQMLAALERTRGASPWTDIRRRFFANRAARRSVWLLAVFAFVSLLAPLWPLPSPVTMHLAPEAQAPVAPWKQFGTRDFKPDYWELNALDSTLVRLRKSAFGKFETGRWLGSDSKGRDTLSRIVWGSRTSILVALAAALTSLVVGVTWGAVAGLSGGKLDDLMMRTVDVLQSLPTIFVVIFVLSFMGATRADLASERLLSREQVFFLVIGAVSWLSMARVVRGQVLSLAHAPFVEAARTMGASMPRIVLRHIVPNVLPIVVVYLTLTIPSVMLYESFLSFLGLGVEAPRVSWGLLAADGTEALNALSTSWWLVAAPAVAMGATLLALGFVGDGLRDALDPKHPGGGA
jgi:oligopeptide transport system permease protein